MTRPDTSVFSRVPGMDYERAPCPRCGATTIVEAETRCRPERDITDEWVCPAGENEDAEGYLCQPSAQGIANLNAWVDEQARLLKAEEASGS
jgi:hypothetical protein